MADLGIPAPPHIKDADLRRFLLALYRNVQILLGELGETDDRAVLVSDLRTLGILGVQQSLVGDDQTDLLYDPNAPDNEELTSPKPLTYETYTSLTGEPYTGVFGDPYLAEIGVP